MFEGIAGLGKNSRPMCGFIIEVALYQTIFWEETFSWDHLHLGPASGWHYSGIQLYKIYCETRLSFLNSENNILYLLIDGAHFHNEDNKDVKEKKMDAEKLQMKQKNKEESKKFGIEDGDKDCDRTPPPPPPPSAEPCSDEPSTKGNK